MILFSGALLLTPGFFTAFVGFALSIPAGRKVLFQYLRTRGKVQSYQMGPDGGQNPHSARRHPQDRVIDGEFEEIIPENPPQNGPSGWTKH